MKKISDQRICSVARTLEILGDRWTFLILREAFFGIKSYDQFRLNLGIATNILSKRLKILLENGIMERSKDREDARRFKYRLTEKGLDLYAIPLAMMVWGDKWLAEDDGPPLLLKHKKCDHDTTPVLSCSHCGDVLLPREVSYRYTDKPK